MRWLAGWLSVPRASSCLHCCDFARLPLRAAAAGADDGDEEEAAGAAEEEDAAAAGGAEVPDDAELQRMMEQMKDMGMQHTEL